MVYVYLFHVISVKHHYKKNEKILILFLML
jgi:hypothetical protein